MEQNICKFNFNRSSDLICTDFVYETKERRMAAQESHLFGIVARGEGTLFVDGRELLLTAGTFLFVPRGMGFSVTGNAEYLYIRCHGRRADELVERARLLPDRYTVELGENGEKLATFGLECLKSATEQNLDLFGEAVLLYLFSHLAADKQPQNDVVSKMVLAANENFSNAAFSLAHLSSELKYDAKYLSFLFKKRRGICFTDYLRELRVKHAIFLIEQGVLSVKSIAILSGFKDALYFSKVFKDTTGEAPKSYIERVQSQKGE